MFGALRILVFICSSTFKSGLIKVALAEDNCRHFVKKCSSVFLRLEK